MRQTRMIQPNYAGKFHCIGPNCEDTCCSGWLVSVDEIACRKYENLPDTPLRALLNASIQRSRNAVGSNSPFATIRMLHSGDCPILSSERLCRIQVEHGESFLCRTCAEFPRTARNIDGLEETSLSLSCPEAARLVLLSPALLPSADAPGHKITWDETAKPAHAVRPFFWQIRAFVIRLILNRDYPLWQRLFLLGSFCRRLEALSRGETDRTVPQILDDFSRALDVRELRAEVEAIPADTSLQLEIVLRLVAERVNNRAISPRLRKVLSLFVAGIGHSGTASMASQASRYADAYTRYYVPFFHRYPRILQNFLVNAIFRGAFPFGSKLNIAGAEPEPARAFGLLAIQFALTKGLLIGVAGARKQRFTASDVVKTVQTSFKHFEHNPAFLSDAYAMLASRGLADARGLTMLLRN